MKKWLFLLPLLTLLGTLCGCGTASGRTITLSGNESLQVFTPEAESVDSVWAVSLENLQFTGSSDVSVSLIPSKRARVEVSCSSDIYEYGFAVKMENGLISVKTDFDLPYRTRHFDLKIYGNYSAVTMKGNCTARIGAAGLSALKLTLEGAFSCSVNDAENCAVTLVNRGAGAVTMNGTAESLSARIEGAGNLDARALLCRTADLRVDGVGSITASVSDALNAAINGVGSIEYYGSPELVRSVNGIGKVSQAAAAAYSPEEKK